MKKQTEGEHTTKKNGHAITETAMNHTVTNATREITGATGVMPDGFPFVTIPVEQRKVPGFARLGDGTYYLIVRPSKEKDDVRELVARISSFTTLAQ